MKLDFESFCLFDTELGSLWPAFFKLFKRLNWDFLMGSNLRIFLFEFIRIICVGHQDIIWKGTEVDWVFGIGIIGEFFGDVSGKLSHVAYLLEGDKRNRVTFLLGSGSSTGSVNKDLMVWWVIVLNDEIDWGNIETSGSNICDDQDDVGFFLSKCVQVVSSLIHVHLTVDTVAFIKFPNNWKQVIDMESSWCKNNHFLLFYDFLKHIK